MNSASKELKPIFAEFPEAFINSRNELILYPKTNLYFLLDDIETELELKCKILEWCSRDAFKTEPYRSWRSNVNYNTMILSRINAILETNFSNARMEMIYVKLGNGVNRPLCEKFILSNYDMGVLTGEAFK